MLDNLLGDGTKGKMIQVVEELRRELGDFPLGKNDNLISSIKPLKFGRENFWTYILHPLFIWEYLESVKLETINDNMEQMEQMFQEEYMRNVSHLFLMRELYLYALF